MYLSSGLRSQVVAKQSRSNLNKRLALSAPNAQNETAIAIAETGGMASVPIVNIANDLAYAKYPGQIYLNLDMNPGTTVDREIGDMEPLKFSERRAGTLIDQPAAYEMSIIRFNVNTSDVPIAIVSAKTGQTDPNKLIYDVSIYQNVADPINHTVTQSVQWVPQYQNQPTPAQPLINQDVSETSRYYWLTDYVYFVNLVNTALQAAQTAYNTLTITNYEAPFIRYDENSHLMTLFAPAIGYAPHADGTAPDLGLYFNSALRLLFPGFKEEIYPAGANNQTTDLTWNYPFVPDIGGDNIYVDVLHAIVPVPNPHNQPHLFIPWNSTVSAGAPNPALYFPGNNPDATLWIESSQQFPALQNWSTFSGLVFTTTFPIVSENISNPVAFGAPNIGAQSTNTATFPIITDFSTAGDIGYEPFNGIVSYNPTSEYRMTSLTGTAAISDIDITVYWKDPYNKRYPMRAWPGAQNNIKVMFRKKNTTM